MPDPRPVALVTGAARGIGRAIALALAGTGFDVVVNDLAETEEAAATLEGIRERGGKAAFVAADIANLDGHEAFVEQAFAAFGRLDCLVNNAGVGALSRGDLLDVSPESYDRCLNVNLRGPFFLTQRVARRMLEDPRPEGAPPRSIVNITSVNADIPSLNRGEYCVSKAGASMMTQLFAQRLAPHGIAVFEIRPGIIRTEMTAPATEYYDRAIASGITPIARWGEPEDIGCTVATLVAGGLSFTVGQVVCVDGGLSRRGF
jgi:3-oxoacyl-[acyl-carrier protein] reductase